MDPRKRFGTNVRRARLSRGWSQERLAEICGLHRTYISGIELGIRNPSLTNLVKISDALQVDLCRLLEREPEL
ncbi:MAG: helix-turn-helix domain-containing protein [Rubrobacteraceae bacterium]